MHSTCPVCRSPVPEGAGFCQKCGASIWELAPVVPRGAPHPAAPVRRAPPPRAAVQRRPSPPPEPRTAAPPPDDEGITPRQKQWLVALLAFACAAGAVTLIALLMRQDGTTAKGVKRPPPKPALAARPREERPDLGEFYTPNGFRQLYGNYDPNLDGAFWTITRAPQPFARWNGKSVFVRPLVSRPVGETGAARHILVTNTLEMKDGMVVKQGTGCRRCVSLVGAAIFEKEGERWNVISRNDFVVADGAFGAPPKVSVAVAPGGAIELRFEKFSAEDGEPGTSRYTVVIKERQSKASAAP